VGCGAGFVVVVPGGFGGAETATHFGMKLEKGLDFGESEVFGITLD